MPLRFLSVCLALMLLASCQAMSTQYPQYPRTQQVNGQDRSEALFQEAESQYRRQEYRQALQTYGAYVKQNPQGPKADQARLREAEVLGLLGDWQGSLGKYQAILTQGKKDDVVRKARYGIGRAYFKLGRFQSAVGVLESLTASDLPGPLSFATNALLAEIALKKGEVEAAFVRLRLAARDLPAGDQEWFDYLKSRLVEQATPTELEHLVNFYRDSPLTAPLLFRLAQLAHNEGRAAEAGKWLKILKERFPESKEAQAAETPLVSSRPVIGCLVPLTGNYAPYGRRLKQGMELGAQGAPFELVYRDCPNDPAQAVRMVQELSQDSRVLALLGPLTSGDAQAAAEAAQRAGTPLIALSQKQDLTAAGPMIFQVFLTPRLQVRALLRHTMGERNLRRYAVFAPDSPYGRTLTQIFGEELVAQGGILVNQSTYPPDTQDFTTALSPLLAAFQPGTEGAPAFEALFIPDDAAVLAAIVSALGDNPLGKVQLLGTNVAKPRQGQEDKARTLNGLLFTDAFFPGDPNPAVQGFIAAYRQRFGSEPDYLAAQGYMVVRLMARLWQTQSPASRDQVPRNLLDLRDIPDLPWFKGFAADRQADLALYILTIKDGRVEMGTSPGTGNL
jgi:branched-chain amino acid transport system substrate-binding protein